MNESSHQFKSSPTCAAMSCPALMPSVSTFSENNLANVVRAAHVWAILRAFGQIRPGAMFAELEIGGSIVRQNQFDERIPIRKERARRVSS